MVLILVLVMVGLIAAYALSRLTSGGDDRSLTGTRLEAAQDAIEQYAARTMRLPCPADPEGNTGDEAQATPSTCTFTRGTLPWNTIGLRREQGVDAWGRKIAYRVYTGNNGSVTQPRGVSMIECDTDEPSPGGRTPVDGNNAGGLCLPVPANTINLGLRTTTPAQFLAGKGFAMTDRGTAFNDVAYVLVSHGQSGLGGYTSSGARVMIDGKEDPKGDELGNTAATGPFVIKAFSHAEIAAKDDDHFDDFLAYRRLPDLISHIKLGGRDWPEPTAANLSVRLDAAPVGAALGTSPPAAGTNLGTSPIAFPAATISALTSGTLPADLTYMDSGATGLGAGGANNFISASEFESVRIDLTQTRRKFAATLANFGYYGLLFTQVPERVEFRFFLNGAAVGSPVTKSACNRKFFFGFPVSPVPLATFTIDAGVDFDRVEITPVATPVSAYFLLSEITACTASAPTCTTSFAPSPPAGICP